MKIEKAILPYKDRLLAITARSPESNIPIFAKIIPHVPYLKTPTTDSLAWAINKIAMRERLSLHDKTITPKFKVIEKFSKKIIKEIKDEVGFPLVIKPTGLAQSLLVSACYHEEELEDVLKKTFKKIQKIYKENHREVTPQILVEQFMEGLMYSIDGYIDSKGRIRFCPLAYVKTGREVGFDDFFSYQAITPSTLQKDDIHNAHEVAKKTAYALGLRNTTVHIELMKTNDGWKTIELGPRIGGFRHLLYKYSFGIEHELNDILVRMSKKTHIPKKTLGYSVAIKFFAKKEGIIAEIKGIKKIQELSSFKNIEINHKVGDRCIYAKHGGKSVFNVILSNKDRSELFADIRRAEQAVEIKTTKKNNS